MGVVKFLFIFIVTCFFLLLLELGLPIYASVQERHCDPALYKAENNPLGYRPRKARCEGIYIKEVRNKALAIVSLTQSFENYDLASGKDLSINWTAPTSGSSRLRAQGVRPRLYFRMDTVRPPGESSFSWPLNILSALNITRKDIGVLGWTRLPIGETERTVYLPLRIHQQRNITPSSSYKLVILPGLELKEIYISLAIVGMNGNPRVFLKDAEALEYGYYPAGRGIAVPISDLQETGIYFIEVGATIRGGGSSTIELWFYHYRR